MATGASGITGTWATQYVNAGSEGPESPNWGTPVLTTGVPGSNTVNELADLGATIPADVGGSCTDDNAWMSGASPATNYEAQGDHVTGVGTGLINPGLDVYDSADYRSYAPGAADLAYMAKVHADGGSGRDSSSHAFVPQNMQPYLEHELIAETDNTAVYDPHGMNTDFHGPNARTARDDFRFVTHSGSEWLDFQQDYKERPVYPNVAAQGVVPTSDKGLYLPDNSTSVYGGYETVLPSPYQESPDPAVNTAPVPDGAPMGMGF
jgi:hypothetical protein